MLRNLATENQKGIMGQGSMYDKLGLLNGQAWARPNPWYTPNVGMPGIGAPAYHQSPPNHLTMEKKRKYKTQFQLSTFLSTIFHSFVIKKYFY